MIYKSLVAWGTNRRLHPSVIPQPGPQGPPGLPSVLLRERIRKPAGGRAKARPAEGDPPRAAEQPLVDGHVPDPGRVRVDLPAIPRLERVLLEMRRTPVREALADEEGLQRSEVPLPDHDVDIVRPPVRCVALHRHPPHEDGAVPHARRDPLDDRAYVHVAASSNTLSNASGSRRRPGSRASGKSR